jgi:hypothetical protein
MEEYKNDFLYCTGREQKSTRKGKAPGFCLFIVLLCWMPEQYTDLSCSEIYFTILQNRVYILTWNKCKKSRKMNSFPISYVEQCHRRSQPKFSTLWKESCSSIFTFDSALLSVFISSGLQSNWKWKLFHLERYSDIWSLRLDSQSNSNSNFYGCWKWKKHRYFGL